MPFKPRRLTHNWRLKLLALGLAVFLWALVQNEPNIETLPSVPVRIDVADTAWTTAGPPTPATVEVRLAGPAGEMVRLPRLGPVMVVPVASVGRRDTIISLRDAWVDLGEGTGLNVEDISPSEVRVTFERAVTRVLPASVRLEGRLGSHLALAAPVTLHPHMIRVHGPRARVAALDSVPLLPLDLSKVDASGSFELGVDTALLQDVDMVPGKATVTVRVEEAIERVLPPVPVEIDSGAAETGLVVRPPSVRVTLSGARSLVTGLDPGGITVRIVAEELRGMTPGEERRVPLHVEGVPPLVSAVPDQDMATVTRPARAHQTHGAGGGAGRR